MLLSITLHSPESSFGAHHCVEERQPVPCNMGAHLHRSTPKMKRHTRLLIPIKVLGCGRSSATLHGAI